MRGRKEKQEGNESKEVLDEEEEEEEGRRERERTTKLLLVRAFKGHFKKEGTKDIS